jgi:hypothetical protein
VSEIKILRYTKSNSLAGKVTMAVAIDPRTETCVGLKMSPGFTPLLSGEGFPRIPPLLLLSTIQIHSQNQNQQWENC